MNARAFLRERRSFGLVAPPAVALLSCLAAPGLAAWPSDPAVNVPACTATANQTLPGMVADGSGGVFVTWSDARAGNPDVYALHFRSDGARWPGWPVDGLGVSTLASGEYGPQLAPDGQGGAYIAWSDRRSGNLDLYAHHLLADGGLDPAWPAGGLAVCALTGDQSNHALVDDGQGGFLIAWMDGRDGWRDLYVQHLLASGEIDPEWPANGRPVCVSAYTKLEPRLVGDAAGGAIVVWQDPRNGQGRDLYASRVLASGALDPFWPANGRAVVVAAGDQSFQSLAPDGDGGALIAWMDPRAGNADIYAQRILRSGEVHPAWPANGLALAASAQEEAIPVAVTDGAHGAIVVFRHYDAVELADDLHAARVLADGTLENTRWYSSTYGWGRVDLAEGAGDVDLYSAAAVGRGDALVAWTDSRNGTYEYDVFAQWLTVDGATRPGWPAAGRTVCSATFLQQRPVVVADGAGGGFVAWEDARLGNLGNFDVYCQRLTGFSTLGGPEPVIEDVADVANDQGGNVHVLWTPALGDGGGLETIERYTLWRRATPETWEFLADVPARAAPGYAYMAPTSADSGFAGVPWQVFRVLAHDSSFAVVLASLPDSGCSRDDLGPGAPTAFAATREAGVTKLRWSGSPEPDLDRYRLYRGDTPGFAADGSHLVAETAGHACTDAAPPPCWYRLSAVDAHGNEGPTASLFVGAVTGPWSGEVWPYHPLQNLPVTPEDDGQYGGAIVTDDAGGAYAFYLHYPAGATNPQVRAAHVLAIGRIDDAWPAAGAPVCTATGDRHAPKAVARTGGAIAAWEDYRTAGVADLYCLRITSTGLPPFGWPADGLAVCTAAGAQTGPEIVATLWDGAIIAWSDRRGSTWDVYAQRVSGSGSGMWAANGVVVTAGANDEDLEHLAADGEGGAYVAWRNTTTGALYVHHLLASGVLDAAWPAGGRLVHANAAYAQLVECSGGVIVIAFEGGAALVARRVTSAGAFDPAWPAGGVPLVATAEAWARGVPDGANGAMVAWAERPAINHYRIAAQHVTASGALPAGWPAAGVTLAAGFGSGEAHVVRSGNGEPLVTWHVDDYNDAHDQDVRAQRIVYTGVVDPSWPAAGRDVCRATGRQWVTGVCPDASGGSIAIFDDERTGATRVFVQRVEATGALGHAEPLLTAVRDVAGDQGGRVRVEWRPSLGEYPPFHGITEYTLWRRLTLEAAAAARARGASLFAAGEAARARPGALRQRADATGSTWWEYVASVPAAGLESYAFLAPTTADSLPGEVFWNVFFVDAQDTSWATNLFYPSALDSGYSADNLSPRLPTPCFGYYANGSTSLHWPVSDAPDFARYRIYRNTTWDFPGPAGLVAERADTGYVDSPGAPFYYFLNVVDAHGNVSPNGLIVPDGVLATPPTGLPAALRLGPPRPNPAPGAVTLPLALPRAAHVTLSVLDLAGRRVRRLADGMLPAGEHVLRWDGLDEAGTPCASGLYFVRLDAEGRALRARVVRAR